VCIFGLIFQDVFIFVCCFFCFLFFRFLLVSVFFFGLGVWGWDVACNSSRIHFLLLAWLFSSLVVSYSHMYHMSLICRKCVSSLSYQLCDHISPLTFFVSRAYLVSYLYHLPSLASRNSHLTSLITTPTSHISHLTSHISRLTSHISHLTSHVSHLTSHITTPTSHISHLTSHISCPTSPHLAVPLLQPVPCRGAVVP